MADAILRTKSLKYNYHVTGTSLNSPNNSESHSLSFNPSMPRNLQNPQNPRGQCNFTCEGFWLQFPKQSISATSSTQWPWLENSELDSVRTCSRIASPQQRPLRSSDPRARETHQPAHYLAVGLLSFDVNPAFVSGVRGSASRCFSRCGRES